MAASQSFHSSTITRRVSITTLAIIAGAVASLVLAMWSPAAYAASPDLCSLSSCPGYIDKSLPPAQQYAQWLALKNANRIRSGVFPNERKGTQTHPYVGPSVPQSRMPYWVTTKGATPYSIVFPCQEPGAIYPCSKELVLDNAVPTTWEPGDGATGWSFNFGWGQNMQGTPSYDDTYPPPYHTYYDTNFFDLCGPGAADVALYYWPAPPNYANHANVVDPKTGVSTTWDGKDPYDQTYRMRGYDVHLAWQIKAPGWTQPGMMEQYAGGGVTLQTEAQAMNWEASGENAKDWQGYFYGVVWWNTSNTSTFYNNVQFDTYKSNVPVVAEVNANVMPNWPRGGQTNHLITIIGYNDLVHNQDGTYGIYYYTDTCASSTKCGSFNDGGVNTAPYDTMWNAITNIQVNQNTGDGGYIW